MGLPALIMGALGAAGAGTGATIAAGVGSAIGGQLLGNALDRRRDRGAMSDKWNFMADRGLTPQEIAGSPAAGGNGSSTGAQVLGNQLNTQLAMRAQQEYEANQKNLDRAVMLSGQETQKEVARTSAAATTAAASMSAEASKYSADRQAETAANRLQSVDVPMSAAQIAKLENEIKLTDPEFVKAMQFLKSSPENLLATTISAEFGIDPFDPRTWTELTQTKKDEIIRKIQALRSTTATEAAGAGSLLEQGSNAAKENGLWPFIVNAIRGQSPNAVPNLGNLGGIPSPNVGPIMGNGNDDALRNLYGIGR